MRVHKTLSFGRAEIRILSNAALSVRIAFGDYPDRADPGGPGLKIRSERFFERVGGAIPHRPAA